MSETCIAKGLAQVMIYNNMDKQWESPAGSDGSVTTVQLLQNRSRLGFRIVSRRADNAILLNSNLFQKLKYHAATNNFHQWRDEEKRVFGLSFRYEQEAQTFIDVVRQAIDQLEIAVNNGVNDYQQAHAADNVYQDPHQHLMHIHSAPNFHHDENQNANFRKTSQHASTLYSSSAMTQQQRRASQTSSTSAGSSAPPVAPPISNIPQAPPPPMVSGIAPVNASAAPPPPPLPPVGAGAPPPPPPPPPPATLMASNGASNGAPSLMDQIKQNSLKSVGGVKANGSANVEEKSVAPKPSGDLFSEMSALFNKRKNTQAKSDAVDSKSNTSNGSSDSGCGIGTNGSNGGSVGSAAAKKWSVPDGPKPLDSPKTHRKLPSASSLFSQEDSSSKNGTSTTNGTGANANNSTVTGATSEHLERLRADLMVEVRLEINKLRQDLMEAQERSKQEILETILNAIGRR